MGPNHVSINQGLSVKCKLQNRNLFARFAGAFWHSTLYVADETRSQISNTPGLTIVGCPFVGAGP
jgi:hypothetical protein